MPVSSNVRRPKAMTTKSRLIRRYTNLPSALRMLRSKAITLLPPDSWDDKNDRALMLAYKNKKKYKSVLALCFSEAAETYHHWKVFAPGTDGVFVEFDKARLLQAMSHPDIRAKSIDYVPIGDLRTRPPILNELPFSKRLPYQDEAEFRFVYSSKEPAEITKEFPIPVGAFERIVINPWLPEQLAMSVMETFKAIQGFDTLEVSQSKITDSPAWRKFAATYA